MQHTYAVPQSLVADMQRYYQARQQAEMKWDAALRAMRAVVGVPADAEAVLDLAAGQLRWEVADG